MVSGGRRVPLALATGGQRSDKVNLSPQRHPPATLPSASSLTAARYVPPAQRLQDALEECADWDRELKVLETSGHTRLGVFAKPLAMQLEIKAASKAESKPKRTRSSSSRSPAQHEVQEGSIEVEEEGEQSNDPFIHQFYDEQGRSLSERLLRGRMRVLALTKLVHGQHSASKVRAELELAEAYARLNLWKQTDLHASQAAALLQDLDCEAQRAREAAEAREAAGKSGSKRTLLLAALECFYDAQCDEAARGRVALHDLMATLQHEGAAAKHDPLLTSAFEQHKLEDVFASTQTLHWQQLLMQLEARSQPFRQHLAIVASRLPPGVEHTLRALFASLDAAEDGVVPFHAFLEHLQGLQADPGGHRSSASLYVQTLSSTLQRVLDCVGYHSLTWAELMTLGANCHIRLPATAEAPDDDQESLAMLQPRVKLLMSRVFLRRGQLEDAVRLAQTAVVTRERLNPESADLVAFYLVVAEALARRGRQLRVLGRQARRDRAERWLQSAEGTRHVRSRALEQLELASGSSTTPVSKKAAEAQARADLLQELTTSSASSKMGSSLPANDGEASANSMMEAALESCASAWALQERHFGREHVTTAAVHVSLAQVHLLRDGGDGERGKSKQQQAAEEAVRSFQAAIDVYERACNGPVPASAFLHLELAELYQQQPHRQSKALAEYELVGRFFLSFAGEFAGSETTRRECCALALDAFRQCLMLLRATAVDSPAALESQRAVLAEMHVASVAGYGEFSLEACESAAELARTLRRLASSTSRHTQSPDNLRVAARLLRTASYVAESVLGVGDRRVRRLRKDALEVGAQLRAALAGGEDDDGGDHNWLVL
ncbi:hypothetical protein BBJ28_00021150 [Nothophytophthora sp. Chile5]|nr:hypothetical protein BBJ28_00021150 [Nothophytophthora sp. Chile5]